VPDRSIKPEILRPLLKACRDHLRLDIDYVSLTAPLQKAGSSHHTPANASTYSPAHKTAKLTHDLTT
jgi:hypothetical protein